MISNLHKINNKFSTLLTHFYIITPKAISIQINQINFIVKFC
jgi:hypothetical protein